MRVYGIQRLPAGKAALAKNAGARHQLPTAAGSAFNLNSQIGTHCCVPSRSIEIDSTKPGQEQGFSQSMKPGTSFNLRIRVKGGVGRSGYAHPQSPANFAPVRAARLRSSSPGARNPRGESQPWSDATRGAYHYLRPSPSLEITDPLPSGEGSFPDLTAHKQMRGSSCPLPTAYCFLAHPPSRVPPRSRLQRLGATNSRANPW